LAAIGLALRGTGRPDAAQATAASGWARRRTPRCRKPLDAPRVSSAWALARERVCSVGMSIPGARSSAWRRAVCAGGAALALAVACARPARERPPEAPAAKPAPATSALVTASAYTSHPDQTDGDPFVTASGRRLEPGMRALAVSGDLFEAGLDFGTRVRVEGMEGEWVVLDRMPDGRTRAIDLYFGLDEEAALRFGRKRVRIDWDGAR
jgi:3D (Asp-Asp-Asp) domain-containing protein